MESKINKDCHNYMRSVESITRCGRQFFGGSPAAGEVGGMDVGDAAEGELAAGALGDEAGVRLAGVGASVFFEPNILRMLNLWRLERVLEGVFGEVMSSNVAGGERGVAEPSAATSFATLAMMSM